MVRRKTDRLTENIARESGGYQPAPKTPEHIAMRRETTPRETESERKERLLKDLDHILNEREGVTVEVVKSAIVQKFALLELEVFVHRLLEAGQRSRSSYGEIAGRLADTYHDPRIDENLVLMVANAARKKIWDALDGDQQAAITKKKQSTHKLPKRVQDFILGLDIV